MSDFDKDMQKYALLLIEKAADNLRMLSMNEHIDADAGCKIEDAIKNLLLASYYQRAFIRE